MILWATGFWLLVGSFFFTGLYQLLPEISLLHIPLLYLAAPLVYLYLESVFLEKEIFIKAIYLLPATVSLVLITPFFFLSKAEMLSVLDQRNSSIYANIIFYLNSGIKLAFLFSVGLFLGKHLLPNLQMKVVFQKKGIYTFIFVTFIWIDLFVGMFGFFLQSESLRKFSAYLLPNLMYFYFFTRNLSSPFILDIKDNIQKNKYEKSKINSIDLVELETKLNHLMEEKIYCDEDLSLNRLAILLEIKHGQLSEYFQKRYGYGFYHFINRYRIEEAKKLILEADSRSLLSIADAVGFNSKSTFNRVFLELVKITPSQYRESLQGDKKS